MSGDEQGNGQVAQLSAEQLDLLKQYVPEYVLEAVLRGKDVGGERKVAAVVFADVSGFTAMSEKLDPEEVTKIMNGCFEELVEEVYKYKGTVDKFIGDCIMAMWGVPVAHENDAELALRCCIGMLEALERYNKTLEIPLGLSIGINYGPLVAATVGSSRFRQYTVMGDNVNLAQRLEAAADKNQILVSKSVRDACTGVADFLEHEPIFVKGKSAAIDIFSPLRIRESADSVARVDKTAGPLRGRDAQLEQLKAALRNVTQGVGGTMVMQAEAGFGKSRLLQEIRLRAGKQAVQIASAIGHEYSRNISLSLALAAVKRIAKLSGEEPYTEALQKLSDAAPGLSEERLATVAALCDVAGGDNPLEQLDADSRPRAAVKALSLFLRAAARRGALLFLVDDAHQADDESIKVLEELAALGNEVPLFLLVAGRPDPRLALSMTQVGLELPPLGADAIAKMLADELKRDEVPQNLTDLVVQRSQGNPLHALQLLDALRAKQKVFLRAGQWRVDTELGDVELPDSMSAVMAQRIDALGMDLKEPLQRAATFGTLVPGHLLRELIGGERPQQQIDALIRAELLAPAPDSAEIAYVFTHPMLQAAAYELILKATRQAWHGEIGWLLQRHGEDDLATLVQIADHYDRSDKPDMAAQFLLRVVMRLESDSALRSAAHYAARYVTFLRSDRSVAAFSEAELVVKLTEALTILGRLQAQVGDTDAAQQNLTEAIASARKSGEATPLVLALMADGMLAQNTGDYATAQDRLEEAATMTDAMLDSKDQLELMLGRAAVMEAKGDAAGAHAVLTEALGSVRGPDDRGFTTLRIRTANRLGVAALKAGKPDEAATRFSQAIKAARAKDIRLEEARALANLGGYHASLQKSDEAIKYAKAALEIAQKLDDAILEAKQLANLASFMMAAGQTDEARQYAQQAHARAVEIGWKEGVAMVGVLLQQLGAA